MIEKALNKIAEQILAFDEASLRNIRAKYQTRIGNFDTSREWERSVIVYFIINSVITKNAMFNQNLLAEKEKNGGKEKRVLKIVD